MFLCIPKDKVVKFEGVQKNIDIDSLFKDFVLREEFSELDEDYVPVNFLVTIRSAYTNKLVVLRVGDADVSYLSVSNRLPKEISTFRGEELVAYATSIGVTLAYDPSKSEVLQLMLNTKFIPIGVYYTDRYPYVYFYSQVIVPDSEIDKMENYLNNEEYKFKVIDIVDLNKRGNIRKIADEILIIKDKGK